MMSILITLACIVSAANSWILDVTENPVIIQQSKDITMACHHDNDDVKSTVEEIERIRILKYSTDKNEWDTMAVLTITHPVVKTSLSDVTTDGHVGQIDNTFLKINFDVASMESVGQFVCEVDGYDRMLETKTVRTKPLIIEKRETTHTDILNILFAIKNENTILKESIRLMTDKMNDFDHQLSRLADKQNEVLDFIKTFHTHPPTTAHPITKTEATTHPATHPTTTTIAATTVATTTQPLTANYTLLKPKSGCPDSTWQFSSLKVSTRDGNTASQQLDLSGQGFQNDSNNYYVYLEMCSMIASNDTDWPMGSYCVQSYKLDTDSWDHITCPPGFLYGETDYGRRNDGGLDEVVNLGVFRDSDLTSIPWCCRKDGLATTVVTVPLPRQKPFYLYRFGGQCQEVQGFHVSNQWIHLDVVAYTKRWWSSYPDGYDDKDGVRVDLCYYTPRD